MSVAETLLNTTVVLIPLWLGIVRYLIHETDTGNNMRSDFIGIILLVLLLGIIYSMSVAINYLVKDEPELRNGLYAIFIILSSTGMGGVYIIIKEMAGTTDLLIKIIRYSMPVIFVSIIYYTSQLTTGIFFLVSAVILTIFLGIDYWW